MATLSEMKTRAKRYIRYYSDDSSVRAMLNWDFGRTLPIETIAKIRESNISRQNRIEGVSITSGLNYGGNKPINYKDHHKHTIEMARINLVFAEKLRVG